MKAGLSHFAFSTCAGLLRDSNVGIRRLDFAVTQN